MNIHQFLLAVRGRLWVFLSLLVATVVAAIAVTLSLPKTYESTVSILVDARDEQSLNAAGARGSVEDWVAGGLLANLKVISSQSSVISLTYGASSPKFAADVANAFASAYMQTTLQLRTEPSKQAAGWFEEQLGSLRKSF